MNITISVPDESNGTIVVKMVVNGLGLAFWYHAVKWRFPYPQESVSQESEDLWYGISLRHNVSQLFTDRHVATKEWLGITREGLLSRKYSPTVAGNKFPPTA